MPDNVRSESAKNATTRACIAIASTHGEMLWRDVPARWSVALCLAHPEGRGRYA
jgi:hypothetical protein